MRGLQNVEDVLQSQVACSNSVEIYLMRAFLCDATKFWAIWVTFAPLGKCSGIVTLHK